MKIKKPLIIIISLFLLYSINTYAQDIKANNAFKIYSLDLSLSVNDDHLAVPCALSKLIQDGWSISDKPPYFFTFFSQSDYYAARANLSLTKDGRGILDGGSIIRLLQKDGVFIEVRISNQSSGDRPYIKIEDGVVTSITAIYDKNCSSIKLNNKELRSLTQQTLFKDYTRDNNYEHIPTNYKDHPEFGISLEHTIEQLLDNHKLSISVYFNLENKPFMIEIVNKRPL
ncbi:hypothetical protein [Anaerobiospirillum thomasii]|uniref:Uncharacterized protein n=1 Tax=Anaerobiospirillum thomasii TaxID=179995 RepID=A0A2X0V9Z3_9GAMM|nr:hypothetical protein [Anaerobiospirillum thomasii]SPT69625.1 Uncharacterised protein [Anaerobiospirillum thomasii]